MRIPLKEGRDITEADDSNARPVILVSESCATRFWPNESPIGKHVKLTFLPGEASEVVGVVGDVRLNGLSVTEPVQSVYHVMAQNPKTNFMRLAVRTGLPPASLISAVTEAIHRVDADEPVVGVQTMEAVVDQSIAHRQSHKVG